MGGAFSMNEGDWGCITKELWFESLKVSECLGTQNIIKINIKQLSGYGHVNLLG
jgi:hypothetical protein